MFSTSLIFVFKTVVVTKPLVSGIFLSTSPIFSLNFVYLCCIDLCELKQLHQEFSFLNYLFLSVSVLNFAFLATSLSIISLNFFKSTGTVFNLPTSKSFNFVFKLFKLVGK